MEKELIELLDNNDNRKYYRYLFIDALATVSELDFIDLNNIKELLGEKSITTVVRPDLSHDLGACPKLIMLGKPNQELEKRLLHFSVIQAQNECLSTKRYVCGWMVSEYPPEIIVEQIVNIGSFLSKYCVANFVPFYEPFRMQLLQEGNAVCPEFIADVLSLFISYSYPTTKNTLGNIKRLNYKPNNIDLFISEEAKFYQREYKKIFYLYITQYEINQTVKKDVNQIDLIELANYYRDAWRFGLEATSDKFIFALMSQRYGSNLMNNSKLKKAVEEAVIDAGSLSDRFRSIDRKEFLTLSYMHIE